MNHIQKPWQIYLLLLFALFLPLFAELLQKILIGDEYVCCAPNDNVSADLLYLRATIAQFLHPISNFFIGGSVIVGIIFALSGAIIAKRQLAPQLKSKIRRQLYLLTVVFFTTYVICLLLIMLAFFVFRNDWYWYGRPLPGGSLYDGAWYNPNHWRTIFFH